MLICSSRVRNTSMLLSKSSFKQQHNWASDGLLKLNYGWTSCYASRSCNRLSTNWSSLRSAKWWTERSFLHSHTWDIRHRSRVQSSVWEIFRYFWHWARESTRKRWINFQVTQIPISRLIDLRWMSRDIITQLMRWNCSDSTPVWLHVIIQFSSNVSQLSSPLSKPKTSCRREVVRTTQNQCHSHSDSIA